MSFAASVTIAAAALIASAPSAGQSAKDTQSHWLSDEQSGCRAPDPDYADGDGIVWSGSCPSGIVSGAGSLTFLNNGQPQVTITGNFRDGNLASGHASLAWPDGSKYDGDQIGGKFDGQGVFVSSQHDRLDGLWKDGALNGHATVSWANGNRYEGDWAAGKADGHGVETWANGDRYEGQWHDGKAEGHGVQTWANGQIYDGEWRDDRPNGMGKLFRADKTKFEGKFVDGHPDGDVKTAEASLPASPVAAKAAPTSAPTAASLPPAPAPISAAAAAPSPAMAVAAESADDRQSQPANRIGEVEGRKLVAVDGSSVAFTESEGGFTRAITKTDGGSATTTFTFVNDRMGTVADANDPSHVTGLFKTSDAEIDIDYADGHSEILKPGTSGVTLALRSPDGSNYCMAWYPDGHVFSVTERKAALAVYATRLGLPLKATDAKALQHAAVCSIVTTAPSPVTPRAASVVIPSAGAQSVPRPLPRPIRASFETMSPPAKTTAGLQPIDVRISQVHLIDAPVPDNATATGGWSGTVSPVKNTAVALAPTPSAMPVSTSSGPPVSAAAPLPPGDPGASSCLAVASDGSHWGFRNSCNYAVQFAYCLKGDIEPLAACREGAINGSAAPDSFSALVADASIHETNIDHQFRWVACGGGAGEVVPKLDGTDPPVGRCLRAVAPGK